MDRSLAAVEAAAFGFFGGGFSAAEESVQQSKLDMAKQQTQHHACANSILIGARPFLHRLIIEHFSQEVTALWVGRTFQNLLHRPGLDDPAPGQ